MFYWLIELSNTVPGLGIFRGAFNVFRYITFRTGGAMVTGALFVFLFGPWIIDHFRLRRFLRRLSEGDQADPQRLRRQASADDRGGDCARRLLRAGAARPRCLL